MSTDLGRHIRQRREELGLSREEVARRTGMDPGYLEHLEERPASPSLEALFLLADALETTLPHLLGPGEAEAALAQEPSTAPAAGGPEGAAGEVDLEELPRQECLRLLSTASVGRLAVIVGGQPVVFPVNYRLHGDTIVFRTGPGTKLEASALRRVAFEADDVDVDRGTGWSVVVQGWGYDITRAIDHRSEELRALPLVPFAPGDRSYWVMITPVVISGRRIVRRTEGAAAGR